MRRHPRHPPGLCTDQWCLPPPQPSPSPRQPSPRQPSPRQPSPRQPSPRQPPARARSSVARTARPRPRRLLGLWPSAQGPATPRRAARRMRCHWQVGAARFAHEIRAGVMRVAAAKAARQSRPPSSPSSRPPSPAHRACESPPPSPAAHRGGCRSSSSRRRSRSCAPRRRTPAPRVSSSSRPAALPTPRRAWRGRAPCTWRVRPRSYGASLRSCVRCDRARASSRCHRPSSTSRPGSSAMALVHRRGPSVTVGGPEGGALFLAVTLSSRPRRSRTVFISDTVCFPLESSFEPRARG